MKYQIKIGIDFESDDFDLQNDNWNIEEAVDLCNDNSYNEFESRNGIDYLKETADYYSDEDIKILNIDEDFYIDQNYFYVIIETDKEIDTEDKSIKICLKDLAVDLFLEFPFETNSLNVSGNDFKEHFDMNGYSQEAESFEYSDGEIQATLITKDITIEKI